MSPPSPVVGEGSDGDGHSNLEEDMEDEMCFVMRRLFAKNILFEIIEYLNP